VSRRRTSPATSFPDDSGLAAIKEAFENEVERREQSEDAYDRAELIPFHQMEQFPGMEKHIDIPSTPRDHLVYMGNVNQQFYDSFPEGHPNAALINQYISMMNREEFDESYAGWIKKRLDAEFCPDYIKYHLNKLADRLATYRVDPDEEVEKALLAIDNCWRIEYRNAAATRAKKDRVLMLLIHKEKEWKKQAEEGFSVYSSIKSFGQVLFQGFRDKMKSSHWARYRRIKHQYAPRVVARGYDINRCSLRELETALRIGPKEAQNIWFARPFESLGQVYHNGYISSKSFSSHKQADRLVIALEQAFQLDSEGLSLQNLSQLRGELVASQKHGATGLNYHDWRMVWSYYRILRDELNRKINEQRQEGKESVQEI